MASTPARRFSRSDSRSSMSSAAPMAGETVTGTPTTDSLKERMYERAAVLFTREVAAILAWSNTFLTKRGFKATDIENDFADGVLFINLLEVAYDTNLGPYNKNCTLPFHNLDNLSKVFTFIKARDIPLVSVDANDIVKKRAKPTVNVLWAIMRNLTVTGLKRLTFLMPQEETSGSTKVDHNASVRQTLIRWIENTLKQTTNADVEIKDFWQSFQDGVAFCSIVEQLAPGNIDLASLKKEDALQNLALAFKVAEEQLGIPSLLQPEDFQDSSKADEKSVENYVCMLVSAAQARLKKQAEEDEYKKQVEAEKAAQSQTLESLKQQVQSEQQQFQSVQAELEHTKAEKEKLARANGDLLAKLQSAEEKQAQLSALAEEKSRMTAEHEQLLVDLMALREQIAEEHKRLEAAQKREEQLALREFELTQEVEDKQQQNAVNEAKIVKLTQLIEELQTEREQSFVNLTRAVAEKDQDIQGRDQQIHSLITQLKQKEVVEVKNEELERELDTLRYTLVKKSEQIQHQDRHLEERTSLLREKEVIIQTKTDEFTREIDELKETLSGQSKVIQQQSHQIEQLTAELNLTKDASSSESKQLIVQIQSKESALQATTQELGHANQRSSQLDDRVRALELQLKERDESLASLNGEYDELKTKFQTLEQEHMSVLRNFRSEMKSRTSRQLSVSTSEQGLSDLFLASIRENKGYNDFLSAMRPKAGWLLKRRPDSGKKLFGGSEYRKRWFELRGDLLIYYKEKGDPKPIGKLKLKDYAQIKFRDGVLKTNDPDQEILAPEKNAGDEKQDEILHLQPKKEGKPLDLKAIETNVQDLAEDIEGWVEALNTRICLINYLTEMFDKGSQAKSSRELVDFITDAKATTLKIENKVYDLHGALAHFKESLVMRRGLRIHFANVALSDPSAEILSDIVARNHTIEVLEIPFNLLTSKGAIQLAEGLSKNRSLKTLNLTNNNIGDEGLVAIAKALSGHPKLSELNLAGCHVSDKGVVALVDAIIASSAKQGQPHEFKSFDLSNNMVGDAGLKAIAGLCVLNSTVKSVKLDSNVASDEGAEAMAEALCHPACQVNELDLSQNQLSSKGVTALARVFKATERNLSLDMSGNKLVGGQGVASVLASGVALEFEGFRVRRSG